MSKKEEKSWKLYQSQPIFFNQTYFVYHTRYTKQNLISKSVEQVKSETGPSYASFLLKRLSILDGQWHGYWLFSKDSREILRDVDSLFVFLKNIRKILVLLKLIDSQNHKIVEVWRYLWRTSSWILYAKQDRLEQVAQNHVLNVSKHGDPTTSLCNLFQCLITFTVEIVYLMFKQNFLVYHLCQLSHVFHLI